MLLKPTCSVSGTRNESVVSKIKIRMRSASMRIHMCVPALSISEVTLFKRAELSLEPSQTYKNIIWSLHKNSSHPFHRLSIN